MAHRRTEIRNRFVELLTTPAINVSDVMALEVDEVDRAINFYGNRNRRINAKDLPVGLIYTSVEKNMMDTASAPVIYNRKLEVTVELNINGSDEDAIDAFADAVERRCIYIIDEVDETYSHAFLGLVYVDDVRLKETLTGHLSDGQSQKFGAVLTYEVTYHTEEPEAVATIPLEAVDITIDDNGAIKQEQVIYP